MNRAQAGFVLAAVLEKEMTGRPAPRLQYKDNAATQPPLFPSLGQRPGALRSAKLWGAPLPSRRTLRREEAPPCPLGARTERRGPYLAGPVGGLVLGLGLGAVQAGLAPVGRRGPPGLML